MCGSTLERAFAFRKNLCEVKLGKKLLFGEVAEEDTDDYYRFKRMKMRCGGSEPIFTDVAFVLKVTIL